MCAPKDLGRMAFIAAFIGKGGESTHFGTFERLYIANRQALSNLPPVTEFCFLQTDTGALFVEPITDKQVDIKVTSNYFNGSVPARAAGIILTLFSLCQLWELTGEDRHADLYHELRAHV